MLKGHGVSEMPAGYWNAFASWKDIVSGLGWGLGYFGMPHIIIRFMSLESQKSLKKSAKIGISWTLLIVIFAALVGIIGRLFLGYDESINANSLVFITMVRKIFPGVISGILLSAVLAASMSTADASSSPQPPPSPATSTSLSCARTRPARRRCSGRVASWCWPSPSSRC